MFCLGGPYHFNLFKGCLLQILLSPFLSTLTYVKFCLTMLQWMPALNHFSIEKWKVHVAAEICLKLIMKLSEKLVKFIRRLLKA